MTRAVAVIVAAGRATRLPASAPKQFLDLGGASVVDRATRALLASPGIGEAVVVLPPGEVAGRRAAALLRIAGVRAVVPGGATRLLSALAGVEAAHGADVVLVHDAARPFVSGAVVAAVLRGVEAHGAAVPVVPVGDTVKADDGTGFAAATVDRGPLRLAQTPQGARRELLLAALRRAVEDGVEVTDEAQAIERTGGRVALVAGDPANVKITTPHDLEEARSRIAKEGAAEAWRVGHGYDVHRFGGSRPLVLGGVPFEGEPGLTGHSDADVVLHAAMDALLGAAGLPDIGHRFPPGDPRFAGADSAVLAREVAAAVRERGFEVANLDLTVLAERPRLGARSGAMRAAVASCLGCDPGCVGIKATTLEGLGALGRGEGIACHAVALLRRGRGAP